MVDDRELKGPVHSGFVYTKVVSCRHTILNLTSSLVLLFSQEWTYQELDSSIYKFGAISASCVCFIVQL